MPDGEVGVIECVLAADTLGRVKAQHAREKVDGERVRLREEGCEGNARADREGTNVILSSRGTHSAEGVFRGSAEIMEDLVELINITDRAVSRASRTK